MSNTLCAMVEARVISVLWAASPDAAGTWRCGQWDPKVSIRYGQLSHTDRLFLPVDGGATFPPESLISGFTSGPV